MKTLLQVFANRRMAALAALGFASGLPLRLTGSTLQVWMRELRVDLGTIGMFSLVTLPYSWKFVWAPLMDRYAPPGLAKLGRRHGWLLVTQVLAAAAMVAMVLARPGSEAGLRLLAVAAFALALFSASQDIVSDAYRTDIVPEEELGAGASVFVSGYRLAVIAAGSAALVLSAYVPWETVYLLMAGAMGVGIVGTLVAPRPAGEEALAPATLREAVVEPAVEFFGRNGWRAAVVLLFVLLFRLPDVLGGAMTTLLLKDLGFGNQQIGLWQQGFGMGISIPGAILGGVVVTRLGVVRSLWLFGGLQALSNAGFMLLAYQSQMTGLMIAVIAVESLCAGLVTAGFMAFLMSQCNKRYSAAQYALLTSLMAAANSTLASPMGYVVAAWGYVAFFAMTIAAGIPGMLLLPWVRGRAVEARGFEPILRKQREPAAAGAES